MSNQPAVVTASLSEVYDLISRFQNLKNTTSTSKSSSYRLSLSFDPWSEVVNLEWGCYDVSHYPRHYYTETTRAELIAHMTAEIEKMEAVVAPPGGTCSHP